MKNLLKFAALGLALTAGLTSCESKTTESTTVEAPAAGTDATMTTTTTDSASTMSTAPAADGTMAPATTTDASSTTTPTTEEKK